jgi:hypothetical protein
MVSLRAALKSRTGNETMPNARWPFQTLDAIISRASGLQKCDFQDTTKLGIM